MAADLKLSKRLTAIAGMVTGAGQHDKTEQKEYCLCDVGTDHAHIPIRLLMDGIIDRSIAKDRWRKRAKTQRFTVLRIKSCCGFPTASTLTGSGRHRDW